MLRPVAYLGFFAALAAGSYPAVAAVRTFVSSTGVDSGVCGRAAPCRTFSFAVAQTSAGGELDVLDTAGYGPVTITQSISINNPEGSIASVAVPAGQNGVTINAAAGSNVVLRGLTIEGAGVGGNGIVFNTGGDLSIDRCVVQNFVGMGPTGNGILLQPASASPVVHITNTTATNNTVAGLYLSLCNPAYSGTVTLKVDRFTTHRSQYGVWLYNVSAAFSYAAISNSIASKFTYGIHILNSTVDLDTVEANFGTEGLHSEGMSQTYVNRSMFRQNGIDLRNVSGFVYAGGNNFIQYVNGTLTPFTLK